MSMTPLTARQLQQTARQWLAAGEPALLISVVQALGSTPREPGARMLVSRDAALGTIGGGHLEWQAVDLARHALAEGRAQTPPSAASQCMSEGMPPGDRLTAWQKAYPLGPALGQCCGGVVTLQFEPLAPSSLANWPLAPPRFHLELHGAGHVGQAIVRLLADIDCTVRWIDMRDLAEDWPGKPDAQSIARLPPHITWVPSDDPAADVADAPAGACHLVLTHRHDLDLRIIDAVLRRGDARLAGLIGSQTKRARFTHRLLERGLSEAQLATMVCPIGMPGIPGKEPAVIAIAVVAQLLLHTA
ncbi:MAG: xanthine dehydrogenase accessory protein XdhC [Aquabacterium sp.]